MVEIRSYKDLQVWQEAMKLVRLAYKTAESLPPSERFGIVQQMCRAAVSIPANIAEGHGSSHRRVFTNHLSMARGSLMELETYILLTVDLKYLMPEQVHDVSAQIQKVGMLLSGIIRSLKRETTIPNPEPRAPNPLSQPGEMSP